MKTFASLAFSLLVAVAAPCALARADDEPLSEALVQPAAAAPAAEAADTPGAGEPADVVERALARPDQALYKGVVGNLLEAVPMDADKRVDLQRTHAVLSTPFTARSIALLVGITNPVVMIAGLVWGIYSAMQIEDAKAPATVVADRPAARIEIASESPGE